MMKMNRKLVLKHFQKQLFVEIAEIKRSLKHFEKSPGKRERSSVKL